MAKYRIAVVGPGYIGIEHMKAIFDNPRAELRTIGGKDRKKLEKLRFEQFACEHITTNYEEIIEDKEVDIVYLCTPNRLHADEAVAALAAGKHVFCEKPMATTLEDCQRNEEIDPVGRHVVIGRGGRVHKPAMPGRGRIENNGAVGERAGHLASLQVADLHRGRRDGRIAGPGVANDFEVGGLPTADRLVDDGRQIRRVVDGAGRQGGRLERRLAVIGRFIHGA
ncbi:Gfo/Idh/MocA family oxidoreductase [bacterium]|nr:Gfo/Idh/MocA family oxidoreductase [bacterium]